MSSSRQHAARGANHTTLPAGARLGEYEIVSALGKGGMAEVYLAKRVGLAGFHKYVVLKRMLPQFSHLASFRSMFLDEARLAASLNHANIVQTHDIGCVDGSYFFVMEYVAGMDVRKLMTKAASAGVIFPIEQALKIVVDAAAGLHAAHETRAPDGSLANVVHRDISPPNILVSFDGCVKLIDFGIAKASFAAHKTSTGLLKGKVSYMSPEQTLGKPVDRRADVFALGIVLYELTSGRRLFRGKSQFDILSDVANVAFAPPSFHDIEYPEVLEDIVLRCLHREPDQRYATARDLQIDLENFASDHALILSSASLSDFVLAADRDFTDGEYGTTQDSTVINLDLLSESELEELELEDLDQAASDGPRYGAPPLPAAALRQVVPAGLQEVAVGPDGIARFPARAADASTLEAPAENVAGMHAADDVDGPDADEPAEDVMSMLAADLAEEADFDEPASELAAVLSADLPHDEPAGAPDEAPAAEMIIGSLDDLALDDVLSYAERARRAHRPPAASSERRPVEAAAGHASPAPSAVGADAPVPSGNPSAAVIDAVADVPTEVDGPPVAATADRERQDREPDRARRGHDRNADDPRFAEGSDAHVVGLGPAAEIADPPTEIPIDEAPLVDETPTVEEQSVRPRLFEEDSICIEEWSVNETDIIDEVDPTAGIDISTSLQWALKHS